MIITDATDTILAPPVGPRPGVVERKVRPGIAVLAVILPDSGPLSLRKVGTEPFPVPDTRQAHFPRSSSGQPTWFAPCPPGAVSPQQSRDCSPCREPSMPPSDTAEQDGGSDRREREKSDRKGQPKTRAGGQAGRQAQQNKFVDRGVCGRTASLSLVCARLTSSRWDLRKTSESIQSFEIPRAIDAHVGAADFSCGRASERIGQSSSAKLGPYPGPR